MPRVSAETFSEVKEVCDQCNTDNCCKCSFSDTRCKKCNKGYAMKDF